MAGGFVATFYQDWREKKSLEAALSAELRAFLSMLNHTKLLEVFITTLEEIKTEKRLPRFSTSFRGTYNTVFSAAAEKIGRFDASLVNDLVDYYYSLQTIVELVEIFSNSLAEIAEDGLQSNPKEVRQESEALDEIIRLMSEAREAAIGLINKLEPPSR